MLLKKILKNLILFLISLFLVFLACEGIVRLLGKHDRDGNFYFFSRKIRPYKYPIAVVKNQIAKYYSKFSSFLVYDPDLGWVPRPMSVSNNGIYFYNRDGIRSSSCDFSISKKPENGVLRIAIFGDSFTHCDDILFQDSWGYYLQEDLRSAGINAEVINFGVGGYGIDQAYLRWKKQGYEYAPNIVIFGFAPEDVLRNVNLLRPIFPPAWEEGLPFSKPRFIFEKGKLRLINVPVLVPEKVPEVLRDVDSWNLSKYEYWLQFHGFQDNFWLKSKFICLLRDSILKAKSKDLGRSQFFKPESEPVKLSLEIIDTFARDVASRGALFYIVYLPDTAALCDLSHNIAPEEWKIVDELRRKYQVILPSEEMLLSVRNDFSITEVRHYHPSENQLIASQISTLLQEHLKRIIENLHRKEK
jgi:hypothetical protein